MKALLFKRLLKLIPGLFCISLSMSQVIAGETEEVIQPESQSETSEQQTPEAVPVAEIKPETKPEPKPRTEPKINTSLVLGMNVRGNKESPLSLTIVPWRSADHATKDPEIMGAWQPSLGLLQPEAYRRNINAFLKSRRLNAKGTQNENQ